MGLAARRCNRAYSQQFNGGLRNVLGGRLRGDPLWPVGSQSLMAM